MVAAGRDPKSNLTGERGASVRSYDLKSTPYATRRTSDRLAQGQKGRAAGTRGSGGALGLPRPGRCRVRHPPGRGIARRGLSAHAAVVCPCQIESSGILGQKITSFVHVGHRARTRRAFSRPGSTATRAVCNRKHDNAFPGFCPPLGTAQKRASRGGAETQREQQESLTQRTQRELQATEKSFAVLSVPLCLCVRSPFLFPSAPPREITMSATDWTKKSVKMILDTPPRARVPCTCATSLAVPSSRLPHRCRSWRSLPRLRT